SHTVGWPLLRQRLLEYPPERVARITGVAVEEIVGLARRYATCRPGLIKMADGINRNRRGGQNVRAICALPAVTGQYGVRGDGLRRDDLFTVVHELFMTDTADYADIVLPATSQLEHVDLHKAYGHTMLAYNRPAIAPLGECKSNWDVMRLLAGAMGFDEPWLR